MLRASNLRLRWSGLAALSVVLLVLFVLFQNSPCLFQMCHVRSF
jgi:hypothetical protein